MARQKKGFQVVARGNSLAERLERAAASMAVDAIEPAQPARRPRPQQQHAVEQSRREAPTLQPVEDEPDETEWQGQLPALTDEEKAAIASQGLSAATPEDSHFDNLWDWVRADKLNGARFFGGAPKTSMDMRLKLAEFGGHLYALLEDTPEGETHVGFGGFHPVTATHAILHLYLSPAAQGRARQLVPQLLNMAAAEYPGREFVVHTSDPVLMRLYRPLGFTLSYMMTWKPPAPAVTAPVEA